MIAPVHDTGRWWAGGQRLEDDERIPLLESLEEQVRGRFPRDTEVHRSFLACYPRHALLRFTAPSEVGSRESFAFYAHGQLYPLDWNVNTLRAFDEVALELKGPEQAEAFVRFATSAMVKGGGRFFVVDTFDQLRLRPEAPLDEAERAAVDRVLHPMSLVPVQKPEEVFRFRLSLLHDGVLTRCDLVVDGYGNISQEKDLSLEPVEVPVVEDRVESDQHFVLVRETSLTAERFLRRIRSGPLNQARVTEPVRLAGMVFDEPVALSQVTFEQDVDFVGARFEKGLTLEQCVVEGYLHLRDARVEGSLQAPGLRFHREGARRDDEALSKSTRYGTSLVDLDASGMHVTGSAYVEGLRSENAVDLSRAVIGGDLRLGGARIGRRRSPRSAEANPNQLLRLDSAEVGGDLDLTWVRGGKHALEPDPEEKALEEVIPGYSTPQTVVGGGIQADRLTVRGNLELHAVRCEGHLWMTGCTVEGDFGGEARAPNRRTIVLGTIWMGGSKVGGSLALHGMHVEEGLQLYSSEVGELILARTDATAWGRIPPLRVKGQFDLSGTRTGDLALSGADVGELRIVTGEFERIRIGDGLEDSGAAVDDGDAREVRLRDSRMGKIELWDLTVRKRIEIRTHVDEGVDLGNIDCGGDVEFWNPRRTDASLAEELEADERWEGGRPPSALDARTRIGGDLRCTGLEIGGRLVLTNLAADGRILFKNCQIEQDLNCSSIGPDPSTTGGRTRTRCRHLDLELTRCGGDVDLAGLDVLDEGSLHARQLQVSGRILLARPLGGAGVEAGAALPADPEQRVQARIGGDLDLSVAEAGQLVLAGSCVGGRADFERGTFRRLDIAEPWLLRGHNLSDIAVDRWEIPEEHLVTFLEASEPFARATYVEIERVLRNRAQDADADRVYRAMRGRAIREVRRERGVRGAGGADGAAGRSESWWTRAAAPVSYFMRTTGSRLQGWLYGWGTLYWAPLLVFSLVCVPLTWWMLSIPDNVTPSLELMAAAGVDAEGAGPGDVGVEWGPSDGFWLTARYHVPIIPLAAREEFRPAQRPAVLPLPGASQLRFVFSAESYTFVVYLMNWMLWPLFLVGLGRRIVRETT